MRTIALVGATGSIGSQAVEVVQAEPDRYRITAIGANRSVDALAALARDLRPEVVALADGSLEAELKAAVPVGTEVRCGPGALVSLATEAEVVVNGVVGFAGLPVTLATLEAVRALDATGWPWVVIETVGVGQVEVEVAGAADTTVVVVNPGWGDAVQANKAGLLEIADLFVINKADRPGAEETRRDLERMLDLTGAGAWRPPVLATSASSGDGVDELWKAVKAHRTHLTAGGELEPRRAARIGAELVQILAALILERAQAAGGPELEQLAAAVARRDVDPWTAAARLLPE